MIQDSSLKAYFDIQRTLHLQEKQVFVALSAVPNATNRELEKMTGISISSVTARMNRMAKRHIVVEDCRRKCKQSGRTVIAWKSVAPSLPPAFDPPEPQKGSNTQLLFQ